MQSACENDNLPPDTSPVIHTRRDDEVDENVLRGFSLSLSGYDFFTARKASFRYVLLKGKWQITERTKLMSKLDATAPPKTKESSRVTRNRAWTMWSLCLGLKILLRGTSSERDISENVPSKAVLSVPLCPALSHFVCSSLGQSHSRFPCFG